MTTNSGTARKILLIDDDEPLIQILSPTLTETGYAVVVTRTGRGALARLVEEQFDVVLLDLGLPDIDGKEVLALAQKISRAPVLVISGRGSEKEKIAALDLGANDYIAKPFDTGELLARIRVALRTADQSSPALSGGKSGLAIDFASRRVTVAGRSVLMSRKEIRLLEVLAAASGAIVSHKEIIEAVWGRTGETDQTKLRVLTWQVRQKIEPDANAPQFLIAEAGQGYRLNIS